MGNSSNRDHKRAHSKQTSAHAVDLAHDFGGAIIFSFPLLMTMEMWWLGFYMDRFRLALFLALAFVMVVGLSYLEGRDETFKIEVLDALVAFAVGYTVDGLTPRLRREDFMLASAPHDSESAAHFTPKLRQYVP